MPEGKTRYFLLQKGNVLTVQSGEVAKLEPRKMGEKIQVLVGAYATEEAAKTRGDQMIQHEGARWA